MASGQIFNVLDCARTLFHWAQRPEVNLLPSWLTNPFTKDLVGRRPKKDPLRSAPFPLHVRISWIERMDAWQLAHLTWRLVLPLRPEDLTGLLLSDIDHERGLFCFGTRFRGSDFNKGRQEFSCPFPIELSGLLRLCIAGRVAGPFLRSRRTVADSRPSDAVYSEEDVHSRIDAALRSAGSKELAAPQDRKRIVRATITKMGGLTNSALGKDLRQLLGPTDKIAGSTYDLRESVNTEMEAAGVSLLVQRYVTGHQTNDIQNRYVGLDPGGQMRKYFDTLSNLYTAVEERAKVLGLTLGSSNQRQSTDS